MALKPLTYGLLGFPILHSLSPRMHNAAFAKLKIKATYKLFQLRPQELDSFFGGLKKNKIKGFNVTYPYKEKIIPFLSSKSSEVRAIGAANTIVVTKDLKLKGYNTDFSGFKLHLKELKVSPKRVALIGAGGAAKAVCFALGKIKAEEICVYDIDAYKSLNLIGQFKDIFGKTKFAVAARIEELNLQDKDFLINASPVGMNPKDPCLVEERLLHKGLFVYDLIYNPAQTSLLNKAKEMGLAFSNGLGMLLYQGAGAFEKFTGRIAPVETMRQALLRSTPRL